jgi:gluconate 2-dehydrogenase gamma chain
MDKPDNHLQQTDPNDPQDEEHRTVSRRDFLKRTGAFIALASIGTAASSCAPVQAPTSPPTPAATPLPPALKYPGVLPPPLTPPAPNVLRFFTLQEAQTVETLTARILPGTPDDPGAREAGVVTYIDNLLAFDEGFPETTYREPPYVELYEGENPPASATNPGQFQVIHIPADQIERYGYQSILTPREVYRIGVAAVENYAQSRFNKRLIELSEAEQDALIGDLADNKPADFTKQFSAESFFNVLRRHTSEGMFSDPAYGGNRNMVGWKLIGFPGAQRTYTPQEIITEGTQRPPQPMKDLHHFHPGEPAGPHVVLPVSGSDHKGHQHGPKKDPFWPVEPR